MIWGETHYFRKHPYGSPPSPKTHPHPTCRMQLGSDDPVTIVALWKKPPAGRSFAIFLRRARDTLPETNSSPLKMGHPKRKLVFQPSIFRDYVSFREGRMEIGEAKSKFYPNLIQTWQRINAKSDVFLWLVSTPFKGKNHKWKNCTELFRCSSDVLCPSSKLMAWEGAKIVTHPRR